MRALENNSMNMAHGESMERRQMKKENYRNADHTNAYIDAAAAVVDDDTGDLLAFVVDASALRSHSISDFVGRAGVRLRATVPCSCDARQAESE